MPYKILFIENSMYIGVMKLPVKQLMLPPKESRLIREPDVMFVKSLKAKMLADPAAPGAAPMVVLCKRIEEFNIKYKDVCSTKWGAHDAGKMSTSRRVP